MAGEGQQESVASVTVAYNEAHVLPRQLDALLTQTRRLQEVIVVDNASTDGVRAMLAERYPQVTVLTMRENLGVGGALAACPAGIAERSTSVDDNARMSALGFI